MGNHDDALSELVRAAYELIVDTRPYPPGTVFVTDDNVLSNVRVHPNGVMVARADAFAPRYQWRSKARSLALKLCDLLGATVVGTAREQSRPYREALEFSDALKRMIETPDASAWQEVRDSYQAFLRAEERPEPAPPTQRFSRSVNAKRAREMATNWITAQADAGKCWKAKSDAFRACKKENGDISQRAFDDAWKACAPEKWKQPGPKTKRS